MSECPRLLSSATSLMSLCCMSRARNFSIKISQLTKIFSACCLLYWTRSGVISINIRRKRSNNWWKLNAYPQRINQNENGHFAVYGVRVYWKFLMYSEKPPTGLCWFAWNDMCSHIMDKARSSIPSADLQNYDVHKDIITSLCYEYILPSCDILANLEFIQWVHNDDTIAILTKQTRAF